MIRLIVLSVDGVLTDGTISVSQNGMTSRTFRIADLDAIQRLIRRGLIVAVVTPENCDSSDVMRRLLPDVQWYTAGKERVTSLIQIAAANNVRREAICYAGSAARDAPALRWAGLGVAPASSAPEVRAAATVLLAHSGGAGMVCELEERLFLDASPPSAFTGHAGDVVALIPVRAGSQRLPNKNLRFIGGQSMLAWAIQHGLRSKYIKAVYVSTESPKMAARAVDAGALVPFLRPAALASDEALDLDVFRHFLNWYKTEFHSSPDLIVQLRATCPVRNVEELDEAIATMLNHPNADSLRSVSPPSNTPYKMWRQHDDGRLEALLTVDGRAEFYDGPTQGLPEVWAQDGFVDIVRPRTVLDMNSMAGRMILGHRTRTPRADVDDETDLRRVSDILTDRRARGEEPAPLVSERLGILQGRLTASPRGELQWFPEADWSQEFELASDIGFTHIEWLLQRGDSSSNPIWSDEGLAHIRSVSRGHGVEAALLCADRLLDEPICDKTGRPPTWLLDAMERVRFAGIDSVVLPLLEASQADRFGAELTSVLKECARRAGRLGLRLHLEITAAAPFVLSIVQGLDPDVVGLCFDSGNLKAAGLDVLSEYEALAARVTHIHVKDVASDGRRTLLGQGTVNLTSLVPRIVESGYAGRFTFETPRGDHPGRTATEHRALFLRLARRADAI